MKNKLWMLVFVSLMCCIIAIGCSKNGDTRGKKDGENDGAKTAKEKLVGTWGAKFEIDEGKIEKLFPKGAKAGPKEIEAMKAKLEPMFAKMSMTVTINADGTSTSRGKAPNLQGKIEEKEEEGRWKVVSEDGNVATLELTEKSAEGKDETRTVRIQFVDNDTFQVTEDAKLDKAAAKLTFKRK